MVLKDAYQGPEERYHGSCLIESGELFSYDSCLNQ
jgi:hypothetical protein